MFAIHGVFLLFYLLRAIATSVSSSRSNKKGSGFVYNAAFGWRCDLIWLSADSIFGVLAVRHCSAICLSSNGIQIRRTWSIRLRTINWYISSLLLPIQVHLPPFTTSISIGIFRIFPWHLCTFDYARYVRFIFKLHFINIFREFRSASVRLGCLKLVFSVFRHFDYTISIELDFSHPSHCDDFQMIGMLIYEAVNSLSGFSLYSLVLFVGHL